MAIDSSDDHSGPVKIASGQVKGYCGVVLTALHPPASKIPTATLSPRNG